MGVLQNLPHASLVGNALLDQQERSENETLDQNLSIYTSVVSVGAGDEQPPCSEHTGYITSSVRDDADQ